MDCCDLYRCPVLLLSLARAGRRTRRGLGLLVLPHPHFVKGNIMSASAYFDAIAIAAQHAFESDWDTPSDRKSTRLNSSHH